MKKLKKFKRNERGAVQMIEAAIIYPIVFMLLLLLIYIGFYILQTMSVGSYAQKIALLASREVAHPYYSEEINAKRFGTGAVESDIGDKKKFTKDDLNVSFKSKDADARAYRYWTPDPLASLKSDQPYKTPYIDALKSMIGSASIIPGKSDLEVKIDGKNYIVSQYVNVTVTQKMFDFPVLSYFGIDPPTVTAKASAAVNDTDELVRNTDFACDTIEAIAKKLGVDVSKVKDTVVKWKEKLGLD